MTETLQTNVAVEDSGVEAMTPRGYRALSRRLLGLPGRVWCACWHRNMWKVVRYRTLWIAWRCRTCGREHWRLRW